MNCPITPLKDRVVVVRDKKAKSYGILALPDRAGDEPDTAEVVAVGPKVREVRVGDYIIHGKYKGREHEENGVRYLILKEEEVEGVFE